MPNYGSFHAADDGRRGRDQWPQGDWGPVDPAPKTQPPPKPKPKPAPPRQPAQKKPYIRPDQGMPIETVICDGKPDYILSRFCYKSWFLREDMWENHRWAIQGIARDVVDRWMTDKRVKHICLMGHADWHGEEIPNDHLGRARANTVRDALCDALKYVAECRGQLDILTKLTIACGTWGERKPHILSKSDEARACNRCVDVYLQTFEGDGRKCPIKIPIPPPKPPQGGWV